MVVFSSPAYTVKQEMKKSGDSEILHGLVHDTKGISSCFSDFVKYHELTRVVLYIEIPATNHFLSISVNSIMQ